MKIQKVRAIANTKLPMSLPEHLGKYEGMETTTGRRPDLPAFGER